MLVFEERGKPEYPEKNLSEQSREPTNSAHIRRALSPLRQPCSPNYTTDFVTRKTSVTDNIKCRIHSDRSRVNTEMERNVTDNNTLIKCGTRSNQAPSNTEMEKLSVIYCVNKTPFPKIVVIH